MKFFQLVNSIIVMRIQGKRLSEPLRNSLTSKTAVPLPFWCEVWSFDGIALGVNRVHGPRLMQDLPASFFASPPGRSRLAHKHKSFNIFCTAGTYCSGSWLATGDNTSALKCHFATTLPVEIMAGFIFWSNWNYRQLSTETTQVPCKLYSQKSASKMILYSLF